MKYKVTLEDGISGRVFDGVARVEQDGAGTRLYDENGAIILGTPKLLTVMRLPDNEPNTEEAKS